MAQKTDIPGRGLRVLIMGVIVVLATILVVPIIAVGLTLDTTPKSVAKQTTSKYCTTPPDHSKESLSQQQKDAVIYLNSASRIAPYVKMFPKAARLVAQGLINGRFGITRRYDENELLLSVGSTYSGWGSIETPTQSAFAWVCYKNGEPDLRVLPPRFAISGSTGTVDIDSWHTSSDGDFPYTSNVSSSYAPYYPAIRMSVSCIGDSDNMSRSFRCPMNLTDVKRFDFSAQLVLGQAMNEWFGPNWNN